jgi:hypothetical protein
MTLWFENKWGTKRQIARCANWEEVYQCIDAFIDQANAAKGPGATKFISYYKRTWEDEESGMTKIDVGSWSEFFYISKE